MLERAPRLFAQHIPTLADSDAPWPDCFEILFASSATALVAICQQPQRLSDCETKQQCLEVLTLVDTLIGAEVDRIHTLASKAEEWCISGVPYVSVPALISLCESVASLVTGGHLSVAKDSPLSSLVTRFRGLFDGQSRTSR